MAREKATSSTTVLSVIGSIVGVTVVVLVAWYVFTYLRDTLDWTVIAIMILLVVGVVATVGVWIVGLIGYAGTSFLILYEKKRQAGVMTRQMVADAELTEAEALAKRRESEVMATVVKPGELLHLTHFDGTQTTTIIPILTGSSHVNGSLVEPGDQEQSRWLTYTTLHAPRAAQPIAPPGQPVIETPLPELPRMIRWHDVIPGQRGDLRNVLLGMRVNEAGELESVNISLYSLFHTITAASSGWGKSAFISSILAQLATCPQSVEFVLVDQQMHGLAAFKNCDRLRYPILREPGEILSALTEVRQEAVGRRSEMLAQHDADDVEEYNQRADDFLPPIIVGVDEASALMDDNREVAAELKRQTWELRKFGVYQFLALTTAKGSTIDTSHRQQFSSKVQMHANDRHQARLLMDAIEALSFPPGRAIIDIAGQSPVVVQTPWIDKREIRALLRPARELPAPPIPPADRQVLDLHTEGLSVTQIAKRVHQKGVGKATTHNVRKVKVVLGKYGLEPNKARFSTTKATL